MMTKTFDSVEMKRRGAEKIYDTVKEMSIEQELEYWRERTEELRKEQANLKEKARQQAENDRAR